MSYCSITDVRTALTGKSTATTGTNTAADLPDSAIEDAIAEASATIDAYVGGPYPTTTPQVPLPDVIKYWTRDIAAYLATATFRQGKAMSDTDPIVRRYNLIMDQLHLITTGALTISKPLDGQTAVVVNPTDFQFPLSVVVEDIGFNVL